MNRLKKIKRKVNKINKLTKEIEELADINKLRFYEWNKISKYIADYKGSISVLERVLN